MEAWIKSLRLITLKLNSVTEKEQKAWQKVTIVLPKSNLITKILVVTSGYMYTICI